MDEWSRKNQQPSFILALGDNFYPDGVSSIDDSQFETNWKQGYLFYPSLRVPWHIILGNHDYSTQNSARSQIMYTNSDKNDQQLWNLPNNFYTFSHSVSPGHSIQFFGIDTNGACTSWYNNAKFNEGLEGTIEARDWLIKELQKSTATWKIVFGHHPLYTSRPNKKSSRLRAPHDTIIDSSPIKGFGFEDIFVQFGVDAYFSGHEHVFSTHFANGVHHFVCGAISEKVTDEWLNSSGPRAHVDWIDTDFNHGFVVISVDEIRLNVIYYDTLGNELKNVIVDK